MLPVGKTSKCAKRKRRSHHARSRAHLISCPKCSAAMLPHHACERCGFVNRGLLLDLSKEKTA